MVLSSASKNEYAVEELIHAVLGISNLYAKRPDLLQLSGVWNSETDILFRVTLPIPLDLFSLLHRNGFDKYNEFPF